MFGIILQLINIGISFSIFYLISTGKNNINLNKMMTPTGGAEIGAQPGGSQPLATDTIQNQTQTQNQNDKLNGDIQTNDTQPSMKNSVETQEPNPNQEKESEQESEKNED